MPRGNDKEEQTKALHELGDQFAADAGNAEALIAANSARRTAELATVSSFEVDQEATSELDLDKLEGPNGEYVVDAVVRRSGRSHGTVAVYEDASGRLHKTLLDSNIEDQQKAREKAAEKSGPRRSSRASEKEESDGGEQSGESGGEEKSSGDAPRRGGRQSKEKDASQQ